MLWTYYCYVNGNTVTSYELNFKIYTNDDACIFKYINAILNQKLLNGDTWPNPVSRKELGDRVIVIDINYDSGFIDIRNE